MSSGYHETAIRVNGFLHRTAAASVTEKPRAASPAYGGLGYPLMCGLYTQFLRLVCAGV